MSWRLLLFFLCHRNGRSDRYRPQWLARQSTAKDGNIYISFQIYTRTLKAQSKIPLSLLLLLSPKLQNFMHHLKICHLENTFNAKSLDVLILVMAIHGVMKTYFLRNPMPHSICLPNGMAVNTGVVGFYYTV